MRDQARGVYGVADPTPSTTRGIPAISVLADRSDRDEQTVFTGSVAVRGRRARR